MIRRILTLSMLALALALPAAAADNQATTEQEILAMDKLWGEAAAKGDTAALNRLLADNLHHVHANGRIEGKADYIDSFESGMRKHDPIVPMKVKVRVYGDTAVSTGRFKMVAYRQGMEKPMVNQINLYTHVWVKTPQGWQLTVHQATADSPMPMGAPMKPGMKPGMMPGM